MYISSPLLASGLILSLSTSVEARVAQRQIESESGTVSTKESQPGNGGILPKWPTHNFFGKRQEQVQELDCSTPNVYIELLNDGQQDVVQTFCNKWLTMAPSTIEVEVTPTITRTTSAATTQTITKTTRVETEVTVVQTSTVAPSLIVRRAANVAAKVAAATDIISSVIANGTLASSALLPISTDQIEAASGLSNACSCKTVDPTSTTTLTYLAPAVQTTVGPNKLRLVTIWSTKTYTRTTTVASITNTSELFGATSTSSLAGGSSTESLMSDSVSPSSNGTQTSNGPSGAIANSTLVSASITSDALITLVSTGSLPPTASPSGSSLPVVIGIPFSCPDDNGDKRQFIVGDFRYEYTVLCDTALVTREEVAKIPNVADATACAAECSLLNSMVRKDICEAALFTPASGASSGSCMISGHTTDMVSQPGSTTILLTGVSSKDDQCESVDLANGPSNATINTAALLASVTSASYSLSTPGLISRSQTGGEYTTYYSSGFTDSSGWYHFSWYQIYASSSAWWEIYATSWSCSENVPQTIIRHEPRVNATSILDNITTIIDGSVTTVISGSSTRSISNGAGQISPISVPASTTSRQDATTRAGEGLSPTSSSLETGSQIGFNDTLATPTGTGTQGSAGLTSSGATATFISTGGFGIALASTNMTEQSEFNSAVATNLTAAAITVSSETSTSTSFGSSDSSPPSTRNETFVGTLASATTTLNSSEINRTNASTVSEGILGAAQVTASGEILVFSSTGSDGIIPPSLGTGGNTAASGLVPTSSYNSSSSVSSLLPTISSSAGSLGLVSTGATFTGIALSGTGVIPPSSTNVTNFPTQLFASGGAQVTSAGNTSVVLSTGDQGLISPAPTTLNSTLSPITSSGTLAETISSGGTISNATNGTGDSPPSQTPDTIISISTETPDLLVNSTLLNPTLSAGTEYFTITSGTAFTSAVGGSGAIPPSTNASGSALASLTPIPSVNGSQSLGTAVFLTSEMISILSTTVSSGASPPSSVNTSEAPSASLVPTLGFNSSLITGIAVFSTSGAIAVTSATASAGILPPSVNISTASASPAPSASSNVTNLNEDEIFATSNGSSIFAVASGGGATLPLPDSTATLPLSTEVLSGSTTPTPSLTPSSSSNVSSTTIDDFNNSLRDRTGGLRSTTRLNTTVLGTALIETGASTPVTLNSTVLLVTETPSFTLMGGYGDQLSGASSLPVPTALVSTSEGGLPSITLPPASANSTAVIPTVDTSTGLPFSNDDDDRLGRSRNRTRTSGLVGPTTAATPNATLWPGTAPSMSATSFVLLESSDTNMLILSTGAPTPLNSTSLPVSTTISIITPPSNISTNVPIVPSDTSILENASSFVPLPSSNSTAFIGTASSNGEGDTEDGYGALSFGIAAVTPAISTGTSAVPLPSANVSFSEGPRTGSQPTSPTNTTAPVPTETVVSFVPLASINSSSAETVSSAGFAPLANSTVSFSNSPSGVSITVATQSSNSTGLSVTETSAAGSGFTSFSTLSLNATTPSALFSSASLNSSAEACPTTLSYSTIARTTVITTVSIETVAIGPSTCIPSSLPSLTSNGTTPTGALSSATLNVVAPTFTSEALNRTGSRSRRTDETATQEQINASCANKTNLLNPRFDNNTDDSTSEWTSVPDDAFISFRTVSVTNPDGTEDIVARVLSAAPGRSITFSQPVTLCPGKQYRLSSFNQQENLLAKCTVTYSIGDDNVYTTSPQEAFLERDEFFTAGSTNEDVSVDVKIRAKCDGEAGAPAGANAEGYMVVELKDVRVTQV